MRKSRLVLVLFTILAITQLANILYLVWRWEDIRQTGNAYQWLTAPVDPYDALRGRYIDLRFKETKGPISNNEKLSYGQTAYAVIGMDDRGYAYIGSVGAHKPQRGDYVKVRVAGHASDGMVYVTLPFKRYYMREDLAPLAEKAYQKSAGKDGSVTVLIKNGLGVVEQLYIGEQTIDEYLRDDIAK